MQAQSHTTSPQIHMPLKCGDHAKKEKKGVLDYERNHETNRIGQAIKDPVFNLGRSTIQKKAGWGREPHRLAVFDGSGRLRLLQPLLLLVVLLLRDLALLLRPTGELLLLGPLAPTPAAREQKQKSVCSSARTRNSVIFIFAWEGGSTGSPYTLTCTLTAN